MKQTIQSINQSEEEWVVSCVAHARLLARKTTPEPTDEDLNPELLDRAYKTWLTSGEDINHEANDVINAIGFAFGQYLVDNNDFEWVVLTDQFGTDIGVRALPGQGDVLICPASMVGKRWDTKETDFLSPIYRAVLNTRDEIRTTWEKKKQKPWWKFW